MQKKLIALAIAGLSSAAFAQSNVTIYGVADGSFESVSASGATPNAVPNTAANYNSRSRVNSNNSLIGFKGAESLGNGLTAVFQFETNVNLGGNPGNGTNGTTSASSLLGGQRDTLIGLAGGFGTVAAGFLSTPARSTLVAFDVMPGATGVGGINALIGHINVGGALNPVAANGTTNNTFGTTVAGVAPNNITLSNNQNTIFRTTALAYITPSFNGLTGTIAYVPNVAKDINAGTNGNAQANADIVNTASRNPSAWNASVMYDNGPLKVGYSYLNATDADLLNTAAMSAGQRATLTAVGYDGTTKLRTDIFGVSYDLPVGLKLSFVYDRETAKLGNNINAIGAGALSEIKRNAYWLGAKYTFGASELAASYAKVNNNSLSFAGLNAANYGDTGAKQFSLRYGYNLSKRTQLYGIYSQVSNGNNGNFDLFNGSGAPTSLNAGADPKAYGVGMRHSF